MINLVTENSIENKMLYLIKQKQNLSDTAIDGIGEDSQPIPRNRIEFIEKIKEMYTTEASSKTKENSPEEFVQDLLSRYEDRVEMVAKTKQNDMLVVIDAKDDNINATLSSLGEDKVQVLSREEYAMIKKLESMGMVTVDKKLELLFDKQKRKEPSNTKALKKSLKKIEKQHKLIEMLKEGGFKKEVLKHT